MPTVARAAAAIQTIIEVGDVDAVSEAVNFAFPGASLNIATQPDCLQLPQAKPGCAGLAALSLYLLRNELLSAKAGLDAPAHAGASVFADEAEHSRCCGLHGKASAKPSSARSRRPFRHSGKNC